MLYPKICSCQGHVFTLASIVTLLRKGNYRDAMEQICKEIKSQFAKTTTAKSNTIGIVVGRKLLTKGLINEACDGNILSECKLN